MARTPSGLPILARGRHRSPRRGACLMELTSLLAGERWTDSPACTHPVLAALARAVNDCTGDAARQQLAELAPLLADAAGPGRRSGDPLSAVLARKAVLHALRVTAGVRRRTLLVALLGAHAACPVGAVVDPDAEAVADLLREPDLDVRSALSFVQGLRVSEAYHLRGAVNAVHLSVRAVVDSTGARSDELLRALLVEAVDACRAVPTREPALRR